jgi:hypothetical protein
VTHFSRCRRRPNCFTIIDLVSRKWLTTVLSAEETATQTKVAFLQAPDTEGLIALVEDRLDTGELPAPEALPILLAVSDNGAPMTADATRAFMALCSIAQHFGRPGTPTDQAPIESFFGHVKIDWPHLEAITDPDILEAELERVRIEYNTRPPARRRRLRHPQRRTPRPRRRHPPTTPRRPRRHRHRPPNRQKNHPPGAQPCGLISRPPVARTQKHLKPPRPAEADALRLRQRRQLRSPRHPPHPTVQPMKPRSLEHVGDAAAVGPFSLGRDRQVYNPSSE